MSISIGIYLTGVFLGIVFAAYHEADEPGFAIFWCIAWPIAVAISIPALIGFWLRDRLDPTRKIP